MRSRLATVVVAALVAACAQLPHRDSSEVPALAPPEPWRPRYEALAKLGQPVYEVEPGGSLVTIEVRRSGPLANLGHDHVVASRSVRGYVAPEAGRAELVLAFAELVVDEPELRRAAGFDTQPSATDVEATRDNMLHRVLRADADPFVRVIVTEVRATGGALAVEPSVTLNGTTRTPKTEIEVDVTPQVVRVAGRMTILQSDFGIVPFSILGGAIAVRDALDVRFDIVARRRPP